MSNGGPSPDSSTLDLARAYKEITGGEQTAATLEANLSSLEAKLDAMLAGFEEQEKSKSSGSFAPASSTASTGGPETKAEVAKEIKQEEKELEMDREEDEELARLKKKPAAEGTFEK